MGHHTKIESHVPLFAKESSAIVITKMILSTHALYIEYGYIAPKIKEGLPPRSRKALKIAAADVESTDMKESCHFSFKGSQA